MLIIVSTNVWIIICTRFMVPNTGITQNKNIRPDKISESVPGEESGAGWEHAQLRVLAHSKEEFIPPCNAHGRKERLRFGACYGN